MGPSIPVFPTGREDREYLQVRTHLRHRDHLWDLGDRLALEVLVFHLVLVGHQVPEAQILLCHLFGPEDY